MAAATAAALCRRARSTPGLRAGLQLPSLAQLLHEAPMCGPQATSIHFLACASPWAVPPPPQQRDELWPHNRHQQQPARCTSPLSLQLLFSTSSRPDSDGSGLPHPSSDPQQQHVAQQQTPGQRQQAAAGKASATAALRDAGWSRREVYNLPNALSMLRLLSGPVIAAWILDGQASTGQEPHRTRPLRSTALPLVPSGTHRSCITPGSILAQPHTPPRSHSSHSLLPCMCQLLVSSRTPLPPTHVPNWYPSTLLPLLQPSLLQWSLAVPVLAVSAATDWADGYAARHLDQPSVIGSYLDPLADKVLICSVIAALGWSVSGLPGWQRQLAGCAVRRDVLGWLGGQVLCWAGGCVGPGWQATAFG